MKLVKFLQTEYEMLCAQVDSCTLSHAYSETDESMKCSHEQQNILLV